MVYQIFETHRHEEWPNKNAALQPRDQVKNPESMAYRMGSGDHVLITLGK
jgi:hypothetical protein